MYTIYPNTVDIHRHSLTSDPWPLGDRFWKEERSTRMKLGGEIAQIVPVKEIPSGVSSFEDVARCFADFPNARVLASNPQKRESRVPHKQNTPALFWSNPCSSPSTDHPPRPRFDVARILEFARIFGHELP